MYNVERKRINEAIQQVYRDFALKYSEIQKLELPENEKQIQIDELIENSSNIEQILRNTKKISEISDEDKETLRIKEQNETTNIDINVIDTLASIYAKRAEMPSQGFRGIEITKVITLKKDKELETIDTKAFEEELRQYFIEHYYDLLNEAYNEFLSDETKVANRDIFKEDNGELVEIAIKHNIDPEKFKDFGYQLTVQNGLVAEEDSILGNSHIFYATPEAVNQRIFDLYSKDLFNEQKDKSKLFDNRELKNTYITYAEKNGIEIQNRDALEELPVNMDKVRSVAIYINTVLNANKTKKVKLTEKLVAEIQKDYSKIMNLDSFNFGKLETVERATNEEYMQIYLSISEDSIISKDIDLVGSEIIYATPEYIKTEYQKVMDEVARFSQIDVFKEGILDLNRVSKEKEALRKYIIEHKIEGIDISIPDIEIDHQRTKMIADAILSNYDKKGRMKTRILEKIEDRYPEMYYERQAIDLKDLVGEEIKVMEKKFVDGTLYMQRDFVYIGNSLRNYSQCLYATPEAIVDKIEALDEKIATRETSFNEKKIRKELVNYAKRNRFKIEIPDIKNIENKGETKETRKKLYKEKLISMGKKSIGELDEELTDLQEKEQQAKELYTQYKQQLQNQTKEGRKDK